METSRQDGGSKADVGESAERAAKGAAAGAEVGRRCIRRREDIKAEKWPGLEVQAEVLQHQEEH